MMIHLMNVDIGVGKGINSFKQGLKETQDEIKKGIDEEPGADNKNK